MTPEQFEREFDSVMAREKIPLPADRRAATLAIARELQGHLRVLWAQPLHCEPATVFTVKPLSDGPR
jgi:hypothetical protein